MSLTFAVIAALSFGVAAIIAINSVNENARQRLKTVLETTLQARAKELQNYAQSVDNDLTIVGSTSLVQQAVTNFSPSLWCSGSEPQCRSATDLHHG